VKTTDDAEFEAFFKKHAHRSICLDLKILIIQDCWVVSLYFVCLTWKNVNAPKLKCKKLVSPTCIRSISLIFSVSHSWMILIKTKSTRGNSTCVVDSIYKDKIKHNLDWAPSRKEAHTCLINIFLIIKLFTEEKWIFFLNLKI
jgi:hypothetical protein